MSETPRIVTDAELNAAIEIAFGGAIAFEEDYKGGDFARDVSLALDLARWVAEYRVSVEWDFRDGMWQAIVGDGRCSGSNIARCVCVALLNHSGERI